MNKIRLIIIFFVVNFFQSCSSFLEENPKDRYVIGNFYSGASDAEAAVNAVYQQLYSIYDRHMFLLNALPADDEKNGLGMPNQYLQDLEYLRHTSENQFVRDMWSRLYSGIARANTAIINIPAITMEETLKNRLLAEAKFLRALYYFNLVRFWGDVPLILKLETVTDAMGPRVPQKEIYQQIISDLEDAENSLPEKYNATETGRATKGAAKILLGKVYLTMHEFGQCIDKLAEVISKESDYGYGLHEDFADNWKKDTENGKEMVFTIEYMGPPGKGNPEMVLIAPKYSMAGGFGAIGLSNGNEADIPTMDLYSQYAEGDERKAVTLRTEYVSLKDGSIHESSIPLFGKYFEDGAKIPTESTINLHILRYSDALLMYAEALNETGKTADAYAYLNRVVERAFNDANHNYSGLTQEGFRQAVWQERRLELAFEGHRWFDLVRTGRFIQRMKEHSAYEASVAESNKTEIAQNVKDYMILYPVPQREIDLNHNLTQNPGY